MGTSRVTVVGAGIVGLTCAVRLAEAGFEVDVLARDLPLETTSAVAGGLWLPYLAHPAADVARWAARTLEVLKSQLDDDAGVRLLAGHLLGEPGRPEWAHGLEEAIRLREATDPAVGHSHGWRLRVPLVNTGRYLPWLVERLKAAGGTLTRSPLSALPTRGLVVNCTGIAARALAADPSVRPVRGQVVRVADPGIETWCSDASDPQRPVYVLPHGTHVVVGGSAETDDWNTTPEPQQAREILLRAARLVPELAGAAVLGHRVGLRPTRPSVRLEVAAGPTGSVVHCYGHGGSGITLAWGCAGDVLDLVSSAAAR